MKNIAVIVTKELYTYFVSPIAYFVFFIFTAVSGFLFYVILGSFAAYQYSTTDVIQTLFNNISVTLLFFTPALTMKLFAEEKKTGTIELLMTSPLKDTEVVLGKFVASWIMLFVMLLLTLIFPLITARFGNLDIGPVISGYLGLLLLGSTFLALGVMISSMTKNQIVSALTSFGLLLSLWIIGFLSNRGGKIGDFLGYLSLTEHFSDFSRGTVSFKHTVYYLSFTIVCLFFTVKSFESSKWR